MCRTYNFARIDGGITGNDRQAAIDKYCDADSSVFVMLLTTRAGGVGINLTAADTCIIYDSDWNPQSDLQAQARCHRIGQKKAVKVYRLLCAKTYEIQMFHKASLKLGLDKAVLGSMTNSDSIENPNLSNTEIQDLLKYGAYEIFRQEKEGTSDASSKEFCEASIDQILERSKKIVSDTTNSKAGSTFSKASFVSGEGDESTNVDVDDPDFLDQGSGTAPHPGTRLCHQDKTKDSAGEV